MKEKIKEFFDFVKRAWVAGWRGKVGLALLIFSLFFFVRLFSGTPNIPGFIRNMIRLNHEQTALTNAQNDLENIKTHVYLLQHPNSAPDYIEELGLKTLNLGNPEFKELKY
jgi:hypothetical protein